MGQTAGAGTGAVSAEDSAKLKAAGLANLRGPGAWASYDNGVPSKNPTAASSETPVSTPPAATPAAPANPATQPVAEVSMPAAMPVSSDAPTASTADPADAPAVDSAISEPPADVAAPDAR